MLECWNMNPQGRPSFETLQEDFSDFDTALEKKYYKDPQHLLSQNNYTNEFSPKKSKSRSKEKKGQRRKERK